MCICSTIGGKAAEGVALKEFTVHLEWDYAYQWFPALLNMQAPTVFLREMWHRPLSSNCKPAFHYLPFMGMKIAQGLPGRCRAQVENHWWGSTLNDALE